MHRPGKSGADVVEVGTALVVKHPKFQVEISSAMAFAEGDFLSGQEMDQ